MPGLDLQITGHGPLWDDPGIAARFDADVSAALVELGALGQRLIVENSPRGVSSGGGGLRGSIFSELRGTPAAREEVVASSLYYAPIVEVGRQPGQRRPPLGPIQLWVIRKLNVAPADAPRVAFLVARKIGAAGTVGAQMFARGVATLEPIAQARFQALGEQIAARLDGSA